MPVCVCFPLLRCTTHTYLRTTTRAQDIVVFDEESDRHVVIPWEDAIAASFCRMNQNAPNGQDGVYNLAVLKGHSTLATGRAFAYIRTDAPAARAEAVAAGGVAAAVAADANGPTAVTREAPFGNAAGTTMGGPALDAAVPAGGPAASVVLAGINGPNPNGLTAGEWRGLANCWNLINKYGYEYDFGPGQGIFPITNDFAGAPDDANAIPAWFRGKSMQEFMQIPEFRVYCVVARPFIEHVMQSAVMTVAGRDTGAMLFGPSGKKKKCFRPVLKARHQHHTHARYKLVVFV